MKEKPNTFPKKFGRARVVRAGRWNPCDHDIGPDGYLAWQNWAVEHEKAGSEQEQCEKCELWVTVKDKRSAKVKKYWKDLGYKS